MTFIYPTTRFYAPPKAVLFGSRRPLLDEEEKIGREAQVNRAFNRLENRIEHYRIKGEWSPAFDTTWLIASWLADPDDSPLWVQTPKGDYKPLGDLQRQTETRLLATVEKFSALGTIHPDSIKDRIRDPIQFRTSLDYEPSIQFWRQLNWTPTIKKYLKLLKEAADAYHLPVAAQSADIPKSFVITATTQIARRYWAVLNVLNDTEHSDSVPRRAGNLATDIVRWLTTPGSKSEHPSPQLSYRLKSAPDEYRLVPEVIRLAEAALLLLSKQVPGFRSTVIALIENRDKSSPYQPSTPFLRQLNGLAP